MKIKVIDLLNMISKGEEVPDEIKYNNINYYWCNRCKIYERIEDYRKSLYDDLDNLNDDVEIIEERNNRRKKIEKIEKVFSLDFINSNIDEESANGINLIINELIKKVDELIDEVNKLKGNDEE